MAASSAKLRRRQVLASGLGALSLLAAPNVVRAQARVVRMSSVWGRGFPIVGPSAQRLAERLTAITDGALRVELFAAGELGSPGEAHARPVLAKWKCITVSNIFGRRRTRLFTCFPVCHLA